MFMVWTSMGGKSSGAATRGSERAQSAPPARRLKLQALSVGSPSPLRGGDRGGGRRACTGLGCSPTLRARAPLLAMYDVVQPDADRAEHARESLAHHIATCSRADPHPCSLPAR